MSSCFGKSPHTRASILLCSVNFDLHMEQSTQVGEHYVFEDRGLGVYTEYGCITEKGTT